MTVFVNTKVLTTALVFLPSTSSSMHRHSICKKLIKDTRFIQFYARGTISVYRRPISRAPIKTIERLDQIRSRESKQNILKVESTTANAIFIRDREKKFKIYIIYEEVIEFFKTKKKHNLRQRV